MNFRFEHRNDWSIRLTTTPSCQAAAAIPTRLSENRVRKPAAGVFRAFTPTGKPGVDGDVIHPGGAYGTLCCVFGYVDSLPGKSPCLIPPI
ncbi:MAG TPA: hypothetical protein VLP30_04885 [Desulfatirhabdiaceae bacterium]|nr:hypothetical protein [Desulfatirhabdiaceae bacterium]